MFRLLSSLSRLSLNQSNAVKAAHSTSIRSISASATINFHISPYVLAQPLRKKHRIDPAIERARMERKKRKLEKRIRLLERQERLFKPVEEFMPNFDLREEISFRARPELTIPSQEVERRQLLLKAWSKEVNVKAKADAIQLALAVDSQERALQELKSISPQLYEAAIEPFDDLLPYVGKGPTVTPPITNYDTPDGNYIDKSKKWIITASGELI